MSQVENEKIQRNEKKKIRAQEKKEEEERAKAAAEREKLKDAIMVSPAYTETETDRADPKINEYIGDINSAVYGMSLTRTVEFAKDNLGQNQTEAVQYYNKI